MAYARGEYSAGHARKPDNFFRNHRNQTTELEQGPKVRWTSVMWRTGFVLAVAIITIQVFPVRLQAQTPQPIPAAVLDIRGFYTPFGQDPTTAANLSLEAGALPGRGLGGVADLTFYVLRRRKIAIGLGGEGVLASAHVQPTDPDTGKPVGKPIHQNLRGFSPQLSLNFGHRNGWSYVTAGSGPLSLSTYLGDQKPSDAPPVQNTLNLGGGARWFASRHVAFMFDIRFYQTKPELTTPAYPGRQRSNLRVLSAGISIR
jgi:hypothetical protein